MTNQTTHVNDISNSNNLTIGNTIIQIFSDDPNTQPLSIDRATLDAAREHYLDWLIEQHEYLDPRGTWQTQRQVQLKLDQIYIGLRAQIEDSPSKVDRRLMEREEAELEAQLRAQFVEEDLSAEEQEDRRDALFEHWTRTRRRNEMEQVSTKPIPLAEAADQHEQLVILGDPGSGKTTLMRYLAHQHAKAKRNDDSEVTLVSEQTETQFPARFPILIRIANYAENNVWKEMPLSDFLPSYVYDHECTKAGKAGLIALLKYELVQGGCLVLLDGLDEIVRADDRRQIVDRIEHFVRSHTRGESRERNRFIITSRIAGYRSAPLNPVGGNPFAHYTVEEMDEAQMAHFLGRWCRAVEDAQTPDISPEARQVTAQREVDGIMGAIRTNAGVQRLAGNPLMLRILALIHRTGAQLPQKRIELYRLAADTLARTWRTAQGVAESALVSDELLTPMLGELAYWMHEHKPTGIATEDEVYEVLGQAFAESEDLDWNPDRPNSKVVTEIKSFLLAVREHTGLFVERAPKRYGFMHLTFEEYYAARHLVARSRTRAKLIRQHLHVARWEEPILLALGFLGLEYQAEARDLFETAVLARGAEAKELGFASSEHEDVLARDYLFALRCLADHIPAHRRTIVRLINRLAEETLQHSDLMRFQAYRNRVSMLLTALTGSHAAEPLALKFVAALKDDYSSMRERAAASLGELGETSSEVIVALITALKDVYIPARERAAASLGELGEASPEVIAALIAALKDDSRYVRERAAASLGELGEASLEVIVALIDTLKDDSRYVRELAAASLITLGEASPEVIAALIDTLKDGSRYVRELAAASLVALGEASPEVIAALIAALKDDSLSVREIAATSLVTLGEASPEVIVALIAALKDDYISVRELAAASLVTLGEASPEVIVALIATLKDDSRYVRELAAASLVTLGEASPEVIVTLIAALKDDSRYVRELAAANLVTLGEASPEVIVALIAALKDAYISVRELAVASLVTLGEASPEVIVALRDARRKEIAHTFYFYAVTITLIQLGETDTKFIQLLPDVLVKDDSYQLRRDAARLIGELVEPEELMVDALYNALLDIDDEVRTAAATALARLGKRFPDAEGVMTTRLLTSIVDPKFEKKDEHKYRTGQDYAYDALWQLVME
ncbi:MAG: HEAT repeat domain-containing protein [Chloroflexota bacterium]